MKRFLFRPTFNRFDVALVICSAAALYDFQLPWFAVLPVVLALLIFSSWMESRL